MWVFFGVIRYLQGGTNNYKLIKTRFLLFATLAATFGVLASCEKSTVDTPADEKVTIYATLENSREWKEGDEVVINGATYVASEGGSSTLTIDNVPVAEGYHGAYDFGSGTINGTVLSLTLPEVQGPAITLIQPMVAYSTEANLVFKNLMGNLVLDIEGNGSIKRAVISSLDAPLAGDGSVNLNFVGKPKFELADSGSRSITYSVEEGVQLPAKLSISLPAAIYSGFVVTLYGTDDQIMSGVQVPGIEVLRGESVSTKISYTPDTVPPTYITATMENDALGAAHTWGAASVIYVNGTPVQIADAAKGEFGPVATADLYLASTSSTSVNGVSGNAMRVSIATTQSNKSTLSALNPAVAKSETNTLVFSYLAGVVSVDVTGPQNLRKATLSGKNNRRLTGAGVVDMATETPRLSLGSDASKDVVFDCGSAGMSLESGATLRFVVPAEAYTEGFTLTLEATTGQTYSIELDGITVERNMVSTYEAITWESHQNDGNDLSKLGYANCYMVHQGGEYTFKTRRVDNTPINNIAKVDWLWASVVEGESENVLVSDILYADGLVTFTASEHKGNALLAAFDTDGAIVWSWHIWLTDKPEIIDFQNNAIPQSGGLTDGYYCMDRNLGATSATAMGDYETFGLYYQWGRKDPFIGDKTEERTRDVQNGGWMNVVEPFANSSTLTVCNPAYTQAQWVMSATCNSIAYATANPMTFLSGDPNAGKASWVDKNTLGDEKGNILYDAEMSLWRTFHKSNYDPCPVGYQVPRKAMWVSLVSTNCVATDYKGFVHNAADGSSVWFPSAGYRSAHPADGGALMSVQNDTGFVKIWSSELEVAETAYSFTYNDPYYNAAAGSAWANGYNVRCVKAY